MLRKLSFFTLAIMALLTFRDDSFAQAPAPTVGDYGSVASGNWSALTTWKQWDGSGWNTTPSGTPGSSKQVFILTGTTVTYDANSQNCKNLIVQSGAALQSNVTLPCATGSLMFLKVNGDTVWVDGNLGGGVDDALSIETRNTTDYKITLCGTGGSVNLACVRPNSGQSGTITFVFARSANINYAGTDGLGGAGIYTQRGTQTNSTITVGAGDTLNFAAHSNFMINSNPLYNGVMNTILNVDGVMNLTSGNLVLADSAAYYDTVNVGSTGILNLGGTLTPYLNGGNVAAIRVASGGAIYLLDGSIADFSNTSSTVTGAGMFASQSGSTINIGSNAGLDPSTGPIRTTMTNLGKGANYQYIGSGVTMSGSLLPDTVGSLVIGIGAVVTLTSPVVINNNCRIDNTLNVQGTLGCGSSGTINISSAHALNILSGGTADFSNPNAVASGDGAFVLNAGGTIKVGATAGLDPVSGPVRTAGTNIFSKSANYTFVGSGLQGTGSLLPDSVANLTIANGAIDTLTSHVAVLDTFFINGAFRNLGKFDTSHVTIVNGTYEHAFDGGAIPAATWNAGSTCLVTGTSTLNPTGGNQSFCNLVVDCPTLTAPSIPIHFDMVSNTITGNVTIHNTNGSYFALTGFDTPGPKTITVNGNFSVDSSSAYAAVDDYSSTHPVETVKLVVKGNLSVIGSFGLCVGSAKNLVDVILHGNLTAKAGSSFFSHSGTLDSLFFAGTGVQTYTAGAMSNGNRINTLVLSGSTVDMDTSAFQGSASTFTTDSGATLRSGHSLGLNGNIPVGGAVKLSAGTNYLFDGSAQQATGLLLPAQVHNLSMNNASGVTLSDTVSVNGALTLGGGILYAGVNTVGAASVTGGSATNYISTDSLTGHLAVPKVGTTQVLFPVGTSAKGYSPVWIANSGTVDTFAVSALPDTTRTTNGLGRVDVKWKISEASVGGSNCTLKFGWMTSAEDSVFAKNRAAYALIYLFSDTGTSEAGSGSYTSQFTSQPYTVSRGGITSFGSFSVGHFTTTGVNEIPGVPVEFKLHQNYPNPFNPSTKIEFTVARKGLATLTVYNILGQQVTTLFSSEAQPGTKYSVDFNGGAFASGVYFSVLQSDGQRQIQKMVLMK